MLVGYDQFLMAAKNALDVLLRARLFAADCSDAQFESFARHVVLAAELMHQPWRKSGDVPVPNEVPFVDTLRLTVSKPAANGVDAPLSLLQLLAGAWERLQRSGVLQERRIETSICRPRAYAAGDSSGFAEELDGARPAQLRAGRLRRQGGAPGALQELRRMPRRGLLLPRAPGGGLAEPQKGLQSSTQGCSGGGRGGAERRVRTS